jgi:hypothetical protein
VKKRVFDTMVSLGSKFGFILLKRNQV